MPVSNRHATINASAANPSIRFNRRLEHEPPHVWRAITESSKLSRWFPADLQGERRQGAAIQIISFAGRFTPSTGRFTAYQPHKLLEFTWGSEMIRWELEPEKSACVLFFTNVLDDKAVGIGVASIAAAWHACLDVLDFVLSDDTPPYTSDERFQKILPDYAGVQR